MSNTLLPCPFCGGEAKVVGGSEDWAPSFYDPDSGGDPIVVVCDCGVTLGFFDDYGQAIVAWNSRTGSDNNVATNNAVPVVCGEWKQGREFQTHPRVPFIGDAYYCSNCEGEAYWDTDYGQQLFGFCPNCGAKMEVEP